MPIVFLEHYSNKHIEIKHFRLIPSLLILLPKVDLKRFTGCVIDFDKILTGMWVIRTTQKQLSRITLIFNQCLAAKPFKRHWVGINLVELLSVINTASFMIAHILDDNNSLNGIIRLFN